MCFKITWFSKCLGTFFTNKCFFFSPEWVLRCALKLPDSENDLEHSLQVTYQSLSLSLTFLSGSLSSTSTSCKFLFLAILLSFYRAPSSESFFDLTLLSGQTKISCIFIAPGRLRLEGNDVLMSRTSYYICLLLLHFAFCIYILIRNFSDSYIWISRQKFR